MYVNSVTRSMYQIRLNGIAETYKPPSLLCWGGDRRSQSRSAAHCREHPAQTAGVSAMYRMDTVRGEMLRQAS